jgi:hypothetical protein
MAEGKVEDKGLLEKAGDWAREKLSNVPVITKPLTEATKVIKEATKGFSLAPPPPDPQKAYEAQEKYMNRNNPHYKPMNVDNSGLTKERLP